MSDRIERPSWAEGCRRWSVVLGFGLLVCTSFSCNGSPGLEPPYGGEQGMGPNAGGAAGGTGGLGNAGSAGKGGTGGKGGFGGSGGTAGAAGQGGNVADAGTRMDAGADGGAEMDAGADDEDAGSTH